MSHPSLRRSSPVRRADPAVIVVGILALAFALFAAPAGRAGTPPADVAAAAARIEGSSVGVSARAPGRPTNRGAGFSLRAGGVLATAAHVVAGATDVDVRLPDGREERAAVIGIDTLSDVALLRIATDLPPAAPAPAGSTRRGDPVVAIGDPLGFAGTLTVGHVSTLARPFDETSPYDLLQHDAALNPGSSGGPLVDGAGRVVGMNVAIADGARRHVGIGLALPIAVVERIADRLLAEGDLARPRLGARVRPAEALRPAIPGLPAGVVVEAVDPGSPAAVAGIDPGDLLVAADEFPLAGPRDLARTLEPKRAGDELRLTIGDAGRERTLVLRLTATEPRPPVPTEPGPLALGLGLEPGASRRIASITPDTPAETAGLATGDEVLAVGDRRIGGDGAAASIRRAEAAPAPGGVALLVRRGDRTRWVVLGRGGRLDGEAPFGSNAEARSSHQF
ncbi:MAG: trypsin-like peptidase domain-containing protein [Siculibacillus sp.]|nr:trypsin-like peptidase domain-containing protein [Siculibacillus sp.]